MQLKQYILSIVTLLVSIACSTEDFDLVEPTQRGPVKVGFCVGGSGDVTRTEIDDDGQNVHWSQQDSIALWAKNANGGYTLNGQKFHQWFISANNSKAYFIADLANPMATGQYTYYACYPLPHSINGTNATFSIPATQDGKISGGAGIMVGKGEGEALKPLITPKDPENPDSVGDYLVKDSPNLTMINMVHALRFYVPQAHWGFGDETIERIVFTMPTNNEGGTIAGKVATDVANVDVASIADDNEKVIALDMTENGSSTISLNLVKPIGKSIANTSTGVVDYDFACAAIMPGTYGGELSAKVYSKTKAAQVVIPINNRMMASHHITPVALNCSRVVDQYCLRFVLGENNLGEDVIAVKIHYTDENGVAQILTIADDHFTKTGDFYNVDLTDWDFDGQFANLRKTLNNQEITVEFESEHVSKVITSVQLPGDISEIGVSEAVLNVPYLFYEEFNFDPNSDHWENKEKSGSGINGWSGNQWRTDGSTMGLCSYVGDYGYSSLVQRWVCTDAYFGRLDSPALPLKSGKNVKLSISFTITLDEGATNGSASCIYGYSTSKDTIVGGYTSTIGYQSSPANAEAKIKRNLPTQKIGDEIKTSGDYDAEFEISNTPECVRLTWFANINYVEYQRITSKWFQAYIDNIKVQIVQ